MRTSSFAFAVIAGVLAGAVHSAPLPAEAYGRLPAIGSAALSPDGKRLSLSVGYEYRAAEPDKELTALQILNIETGKTENVLTPPSRNRFRDVGWADEKRTYYIVSSPGREGDAAPAGMSVGAGSRVEWFRTGVFNIEKNTTAVMMSDQVYAGNMSLTDLEVPIEGDPGMGRMIAWGGLGVMNALPKLTVFRVNLDTGRPSVMQTENVLTRNYLLDPRGNVLARVDLNERSNKWQLYVYEKGKDRLLIEDVSETGEPLALLGVLADGRIAAESPHKDGERDVLSAIDPKSGKTEPLETEGGAEVRTVKDPWTRRVIGVSWRDDLPQQFFFDPQLQTLFKALQPKFDGGYVTIESWSQDRSKFLLVGERGADAGAYYVYEPATQRLRMVGKRYPALNSPTDLGIRQAIKFRARDGTQVPAYLTLPGDAEPHDLPLVLLVHGGPHARDDFRFNWWASFLASRGYAVLQANFRGSTGYGYDWFDAGRGKWGDGVMQTDVEDGLAALIKNGIVDAKRVCIMGGSYGGYAALAGATLTPDRYTCAVSVNGLSDPVALLASAENTTLGRKSMTAEWWRRSMGDDMDHLRAVSPIRNADKVHVPVLLIHGVDDSVVPIEQSRNMDAALRRAGKQVRYVELKGDDHWLSAASTRTQMLQEIEKFLAENLAKKSQ
jgi:dipeptidyl aminopeptidase/acylaminoacyl peptidase